MKATNERYEFNGKAINREEGNSGLMIEVIAKMPKLKEGERLPYEGTGLLICGADEGKEHPIRTFIPIKDATNLLHAQMLLEMLQETLFRDSEEEEACISDEEKEQLLKLAQKVKKL